MNQKRQHIKVTRLFVIELFEPIIRIAGWIALLVGFNRTAAEMHLRGLILGGSKNRWKIGRYIQFAGNPKRIILGNNVTLYGNTLIDANGANGSVEIGSGSHIDQFCVLYGQGGLTIGSNCAIASEVVIYTQTNQDLAKNGTPVTKQPTMYAPVKINDGVWIGAGVRILPGVEIGFGSILGAGAVVLCSIPANVTVYGVPARINR